MMVATVEHILDRAIAGRMTGTLTSSIDPAPWQARLLARAPEHDGLWIHPADETAKHSLDAVIAQGAPVELAIAIDHARYALRSQIIRRDRHFWLTQEFMYSAILLRGPAELMPAERRAHPRFRVPDGSSTFAQVSCGAAIFPIRVRPWDVGGGGISFLCPRDPNILKLRSNENLNFVISYRGRTIAGAGIVRFNRMLTERVMKIGVKFRPDSIDTLSSGNLRYLLDDVARLERARH
jgi:hypothetical protein